MKSKMQKIELTPVEKEIMDILSTNITPDWDKVGELMRLAKW